MNFCSPCSVNDEKFASAAALEALKSSMTQKHGCVAVSNGKIIARGYNSHYKMSRNSTLCSCHAEQDVLKKCIKSFKNIKKLKISIYVVRCDSTGNYTLSIPCKMCYDEMKKFRIKNIIYSNKDGELIKCPFNDFISDFTTSGMNALRDKRIIPLNIMKRNYS